jgi:hypothetical protein
MSDALLSTLCALPPLLASMLAFMFQILAWLAIFALPIVGVAGIFPPFRRWLTSLLQILLASYFARCAFGVALTMTELAYGIVFSSPFPFGVQILILLVIVVAAMHLIRAVREAGLTSSWGRAVHGSTAGVASSVGRRAGRVGGTVLAGAAGGAAVVVAEERRERRTRRNTVDRPINREETVTQAPTERPEGGPQVAPRRRKAGVVISADGTTSETSGNPAVGRRASGEDVDAAPAVVGSHDAPLPEGPQVARRIRRDEPAEPQPQRHPAQARQSQAPSGAIAPRQSEPRQTPPRPAVVTHTRETTTTAPIEVRRRQSTSRAPDNPPETPAPEPVVRRQGDRARYIDPEP